VFPGAEFRRHAEACDSEARKFWPLYEAYQRDLDLANRRRNVVEEALIAGKTAFGPLV